MLLRKVNKYEKIVDKAAAKVPYGAAVDKLWLIDQDPINEQIKPLTERWSKAISKK